MDVGAFPVRLLAVADGVRHGAEHVVIALERQSTGAVFGVALDLDQAQLLADSLRSILPTARRIQRRIANYKPPWWRRILFGAWK